MVNTELKVNLHDITRNSYYFTAGSCELCSAVNSVASALGIDSENRDRMIGAAQG